MRSPRINRGMPIRLVTALIMAAIICASPTSATGSPCGAQDLGEARVTAIADHRTITLADGRQVRLAGLEWTVPPDAAKAALAPLLLNENVRVTGTPNPDRYGRIYAFLFVSGSETPVQYVLLERGLALMGSHQESKSCAVALLAQEAKARAARAGFWSSTQLMHRADAPNIILSDRGRFAMVEGRVLSVRESGSLIYVNFGRRWSEDFTVTIAKRMQPTFIKEGLPPKSLAGRDVRVRGIIEERAGPWIEAVRPSQIEVLK